MYMVANSSFVMPEVIAQFHNIEYWKDIYKAGADMPTNLALSSKFKAGCGGHCVNKIIEDTVQHVRWNQGEQWLNWAVSIEIILGTEFRVKLN